MSWVALSDTATRYGHSKEVRHLPGVPRGSSAGSVWRTQHLSGTETLAGGTSPWSDPFASANNLRSSLKLELKHLWVLFLGPQNLQFPVTSSNCVGGAKRGEKTHLLVLLSGSQSKLHKKNKLYTVFELSFDDAFHDLQKTQVHVPTTWGRKEVKEEFPAASLKAIVLSLNNLFLKIPKRILVGLQAFNFLDHIPFKVHPKETVKLTDSNLETKKWIFYCFWR